METVCGLLSAVPAPTPSKVVAGIVGGAPCVSSTRSWDVVTPKNDGRFWILKLACVPVAATVPETRVKRRYTVSTLAVAGVLPEAAVKAVTCTERVCPGRSMDASVPVKLFTGTVSPFVSTRNGFGLTKVTFTCVPRGALEPIKLPELASTKSLVTRVNCVGEEAVAVTMPSIQSPVVVDNGSYSSRVKVPSELRTVSKLVTWPCTMQDENERLRLKAVQLGENTVEEFAMAVREPRVAVFTVTDCAVVLTAVTTPVTSSTKSSCPAARLLGVGGRARALSTFAALRFTAVTTCEAFTVNAFARLKLIASPVFWLADKVRGNGAEVIFGAAAAPEIVATLPAAHPVLPSVCVQKVTSGFEILTVMLA